MTIQGRVILVTGGAKRIGRAIALTLAKRRARVIITYRSSVPEARRTLAELQHFSPDSAAYRADVSRAADVRRLFDQIRRRFGRVDVLVNSASTFERVPFARLTERAWDRAMDPNLRGPFLCSLAASRFMRKQGEGKIINVADWAGVRPYKDYLPYCVSKAGLIGLTKALAKELAPTVQAVAVAPGPMLPPEGMSPRERRRVANLVLLERWGDPQDVANTVQFLIEGTDFMTGSIVYVDGGRLLR